MECDCVVIGGGPAGAVIARLLADWGHSVVVVARPADRVRAAAESLPPSSRKLLAAVGVLDAVDDAGFFKTTGNTVWWGSREGAVETFGSADAFGYQVLRPELDRVLLNAAEDAGAQIIGDAIVTRVRLEDICHVEYQRDRGGASVVSARFVVDASGRSGVVARAFRRHQEGFCTQAFIGVWRRESGWNLPDPTHTVVETCADGWAWSVPLSPTVRQIGVIVDGTATPIRREPTFDRTYRAQLAATRHLSALGDGATLDRVWACDASLYCSDRYADPRFLLVGDAGSCIDPLSSFGVKKAVASAWAGAVALHTALVDPSRRDIALAFFSDWERQVYATHMQRSREFAREAYAQHPHPFWAARAAADVEAVADQADDDRLLRAPEVESAFNALKQLSAIDFRAVDRAPLVDRAVVRGREVIVEPALALAGAPGGVRFVGGVDLLALRALAPKYDDVGAIVEAYCAAHGPIPPPRVLGALSLLVANGVLATRPGTFS